MRFTVLYGLQDIAITVDAKDMDEARDKADAELEKMTPEEMMRHTETFWTDTYEEDE